MELRLALLLLVWVQIPLGLCWPYVGFPITEQLPEVGIIGEEYSFILNSQTFKSDYNDGAIEYKVFDLPDWLSFDSDTLELSGLVTGDEGTLQFILQGTDSQGSLNETGEIYLSSQPAPVVNDDDTVFEQLEKIGVTNGYNGIVLQPNEEFSIKFSDSSFEIPSSSDIEELIYYGKSGNRTSLPSWCYFDSSSLTFYGKAPTINSDNAPSLVFDLTLIATYYEGFTGAYEDFSIVVGGHSLVLNNTNYNKLVNTTAGDSIEIELPLSNILLDGSVISSDYIGDIVLTNAPSWVKIDNDTIKGEVPSDQTSNVALNVTLYDIYGDSVFMNYDIDVVHTIFKNQLADVEAKRGSYFVYELPEDDFNNLTAVTIDAKFDSSWLRFYYTNNTFVGQVPVNFDSLSVEIDATMGDLNETETFQIKGTGNITSSSYSRSSYTRSSTGKNSSLMRSMTSYRSSTVGTLTTSTASVSTTTSSTNTSSSSSSNTSTSINQNKGSGTNKNALAIGLGVGVPIFIILVVLGFLICCGVLPIFKRQNKRQSQSFSNDDETPPESGETTFIGGDGSHMEKLESDGYSTVSDKTEQDKELIYQIPQASTDQLLQEPRGVYNSWRRDTRDSLTSLATVATNDLLTVNMVEMNKARRSQLNFFRKTNSQLGDLNTLNEEGNPQLKDFVNGGSVSRELDDNSEHSQTGIVENDDH